MNKKNTRQTSERGLNLFHIFSAVFLEQKAKPKNHQCQIISVRRQPHQHRWMDRALADREIATRVWERPKCPFSVIICGFLLCAQYEMKDWVMATCETKAQRRTGGRMQPLWFKLTYTTDFGLVFSFSTSLRRSVCSVCRRRLSRLPGAICVCMRAGLHARSTAYNTSTHRPCVVEGMLIRTRMQARTHTHASSRGTITKTVCDTVFVILCDRSHCTF